MPEPTLDQATLKSLLRYDPLTGDFMWLYRRCGPKTWNTRYAGKTAGFDWKCGPNLTYRSIRISNWPFLGHRLAWLYMTGDWPPIVVDHEDRNGLNNRWSNLRPANRSQNSANSGISASNTSGYRGVSKRRNRMSWRAYIFVAGKQTHLGTFKTPEAASAAYEAAAVEEHGAFAPTSR